MLCIIVPNRRAHILSSFRVFVHDGYYLNHGLSGSYTKEMHFQFDIKSSSDFKILSARKLKTLFQKYKLQLTTGIHACIGHVLRKYIHREFLKDTATETSHGKVNLYFFQSLSWLFQLAYFVKCKGTLLELNFYEENQFCHGLFTSFTKREIRHFHGQSCSWRQRNVKKSVMHVQSCCFALSSYYLFDFLVAVAS